VKKEEIKNKKVTRTTKEEFINKVKKNTRFIKELKFTK